MSESQRAREENIAALAKWAGHTTEQASMAVEAAAPRIKAAFESMREAMRLPSEK